MTRNFAILLSLLALLTLSTMSCANSAKALDESKDASVQLEQQKSSGVQSRSSNYFTHDLEATVQFYTEYLGLEEAFRAEITAPKSRATYGVLDDATITVVGFFPPSIANEKKGFAGMAFFSVEGKTEPLFDRNVKSVGRASVVLAHRVSDVDAIEQRMLDAGVPFVSALGPSATGRSRSMTVVDPNGILIETYQYIKAK